jgi:Zn-dependent protease
LFDFAHINLAQRVMMLIPMLLSLAVHEWAHAWSAYRLGDDTAAMQGRLTLNPIAHIDPIGSFVLPLLLVPFGWAKPVPVNPTRFRRGVSMSAGMIITAAAGPLANVVLAVLSAAAFGCIAHFSPDVLTNPMGVGTLLKWLVSMNITLALFNMIPVPPLDGSRVVDGLIPYRWRPQWESIVRLSPLLFIAAWYFGGSIIAGPSNYVQGLLDRMVFAMS